MSEDSFSDGFDSDYVRFEDSTIEINIKTLMGTTFTVKVSSSETIGDVKRKIYRIEGIPIYQQNLIFQYHELKDTCRLSDAGITKGSTLTLISAMRGGPISTRRLSVACEHHVVLKELKDILDNTREEISPGSKVSVLVFKDGDVINLLRVIENEDGSYSPYSSSSGGSGSSSASDRAPSAAVPPPKPVRRESRTGIFERLVEDNEMSTKICHLRKKMEDLLLKKQGIGKKSVGKDSIITDAPSTSPSKNNSITYKLLSQCNDLLDNMDLKICEKNFEEENEEEIALKDKHRSKLLKLPTRSSESKTLYKDTKGVHSHTKHMYARAHKKNRESSSLLKDHLHPDRTRIPNASSISKSSPIDSSSFALPSLTKSDFSTKLSDFSSKMADFSSKLSDFSTKVTDFRAARDDFSAKVADFSSKMADFSTAATSGGTAAAARKSDAVAAEKLISPSIAEQFAIFKDEEYAKPLAVPSGNRIHLTRLVLSETAERPKSSPNSIELEENAQDIWEIHEPATERLKHSATCSKIGLLKRPQSLEFAYDDIENHSSHHQNADLGKYSCSKNTDYEVCSSNFYHMPQFVTTPGGTCRGGGGGVAGRISPKDQGLCDYYFAKSTDRSPLYGRTTSTSGEDVAATSSLSTNGKTRTLHHRMAAAGLTALNGASGGGRTGQMASTNFFKGADCSASSIQRLRNDDSGVVTTASTTECDSLFSVHDESIDELYGYYNLGCSVSSSSSSSVNNSTVEVTSVEKSTASKGSSESDTKDKTAVEKESSSSSTSSSKKQKIDEKPPELPPPVIKKKARCSECNKRLNITNIYDCRCGKMFCSQHRYPEVHRCTYDYKLEGRKILKQQNPLVTAEKVAKI